MEIENRMEETEETAMTSTDGGNSEETKGEAKGVVLEKVDLMTFMFMNERGQRMDAERRAHQVEFDSFVTQISRKYGVEWGESSIDLSTGAITSKANAPKKG